MLADGPERSSWNILTAPIFNMDSSEPGINLANRRWCRNVLSHKPFTVGARTSSPDLMRVEMSRFRCPLGPSLIATLLFIGSTCLISGCGSAGDGDTAVQTPEMRKHMEQITKNYGSQYAAKYARKGASRKQR